MRIASPARIGVASLVLAGLLMAAPAHGAPAVDQYSESIPTAKGQNSSRDTVQGGGGKANISPPTRSQLEKTRNGAAAVKAANLTAPSRSGIAGSPATDTSDTGSGLGLLLPLILAITLAVAVGIFVARRRLSATPS